MEIWDRPDCSACDFCLADADRNPLVKEYTAKNVVLELPDGRIWKDSGIWMACQPCADLIEAKNWSALLDRCVPGILAEVGKVNTSYNRQKVRARLRIGLRAAFGVWPA